MCAQHTLPRAHVRLAGRRGDMAARARVRYRRGVRIAPLLPSMLPLAEIVLEQACAFDRAAAVANEKLFDPGPLWAPKPGEPAPDLGVPHTFGAWDDAHSLVGVAATCGRWLRVLAVHPGARDRGAGTALLTACEQAGARRTLDQPGNYLAPGIDIRNTETIGWLERRGWRRTADLRTNVVIEVRDNPRVTAERARALAAAAVAHGYEIRRARSDEHALLDAVSAEHGGAWPYELARALAYVPLASANRPRATHGALPEVTRARATDRRSAADAATPCGVPAVHVALRDGQYCAFAAHDGNNAGLGWFGPTGTWPAHRGRGLGEALLLACLVDVAAEHDRCEVAWIGPRAFYDKGAGIAFDRQFVVLEKPA
jgi:GNAT superfamily N-acetyltransferase